MANKVKYGLKNVYYSKITIGTSGTTYGEPVRIPGAVTLSLDAQGEVTKFYADDIVYYQSAQNNGYEGTLEIAKVPESFRKDILQEAEDNNGLLVEKANVELAAFALLFEFKNDQNKTRHVMYNCTATRPSVGSATTTDSKEVQTETLNLSAVASEEGYVKASVDESTTTAYSSWYSAVQVPSGRNKLPAAEYHPP